MEKSKAIQIASKYFETYKSEEVVHITEDGNVFLNSNLADGKNHAKAKRLTITSVKRSECEKAPVQLGKVAADNKPTVDPILTAKKADQLKWLEEKGFPLPKNTSNDKVKAQIKTVLKAEAEKAELAKKELEADSAKTETEVK